MKFYSLILERKHNAQRYILKKRFVCTVLTLRCEVILITFSAITKPSYLSTGCAYENI